MYGSAIACFQNDINKVSSRPPGSPDTVWNTRLVNCVSCTLYKVIISDGHDQNVITIQECLNFDEIFSCNSPINIQSFRKILKSMFVKPVFIIFSSSQVFANLSFAVFPYSEKLLV